MPIYSTKEIKLYLVFFCLNSLLMSCDGNTATTDVQVNYENGKAVSADFHYEKDIEELSLYKEDELKTSILGRFVNVGPKEHSFVPLVPFTEGQAYAVRERKKTIGRFMVSEDTLKTVPEILAIYPSADTVPENLLKIYLKFSEPMQEVGHVLDFITVTDETEGVDKKLFLEMESELWNREHDLLTLWLDPGRIKTDLIPNRELGLPILNGHTYSIRISDDWKSAQGRPLGQPYTKSLVVSTGDHKKPSLKDWKLHIPTANSRQPILLLFPEPMDAVLSAESISICDDSKNIIPGSLQISGEEKKVSFMPESPWKTGAYRIKVKSILEDLAGNNLNRLFDEDLEVKSNRDTSINIYTLDFKID